MRYFGCLSCLVSQLISVTCDSLYYHVCILLLVMALNQLRVLRPLLVQALVQHVRPPRVDISSSPALCSRLYATKKGKGR